MQVTAIIAAAGRGRRLGGGLKQLRPIAGRPLLEQSVGAFLGHPAVNEVIVALPEALVSDPPAYLCGTAKPLTIVAGGERRRDSVANAFRAASPASDLIVIHDAARPFVSADLIARTIAAAAEWGAAVAAVQASDTVKRAARSLAAGGDVVAETLSRESIYLAQTPQAFRSSVLADALAVAGDATDEAALAERAGHPVRIVSGERSNIKITTRDDLALADALAGGAKTGAWRAGTGYDLHRLVAGRPLVLGGVAIRSDRGALGHSDADVVCHAATDAILGAACLGDIGRHFPDSDPRWKDARSLDLLRQGAGLAAARGFAVENIDVTVILESPKLQPYIDAMRASLCAVLEVDLDRVSIKAKTNEGVGAIGRGDAIAAHAVALLR